MLKYIKKNVEPHSNQTSFCFSAFEHKVGIDALFSSMLNKLVKETHNLVGVEVMPCDWLEL